MQSRGQDNNNEKGEETCVSVSRPWYTKQGSGKSCRSLYRAEERSKSKDSLASIPCSIRPPRHGEEDRGIGAFLLRTRKRENMKRRATEGSPTRLPSFAEPPTPQGKAQRDEPGGVNVNWMPRYTDACISRQVVCALQIIERSPKATDACQASPRCLASS